MEPTREQLKVLQQQVEALAFEQEILRQKIAGIANNIKQLSSQDTIQETDKRIQQNISAEPARIFTPPAQNTGFTRITPIDKKPGWFEQHFSKSELSSPDFEKFIGENIISKIGILITVIGVGIGTKYAIDNNLISPLTRILLGYLLGIIFFVFAIRIRHKYENFSAIIISGAMAIFYLTTFAAYNFFALIPQVVAFGLMIILTVITVGAALKYNRQWIALLGLVGAYAVPFLLSDGSGKVHIMFTYMALLNIGILAVAIKKYWRILYYSAFGITWLIFMWWYVMDYTNDKFSIAILFASIFFLIFYSVFLVHKLIEKRMFEVEDVFTLLLNAFFYFGVSYVAFEDDSGYEKYTGLFALANAGLHAMVAYVVYRSPSYDRNLFFLISGLTLVFITVAIPVQLDGNWVTMFWASEAALLFYIGRTRKAPFYENLSYPLMVLAIISQIQDWNGLGMPSNILGDQNIQPLLNKAFALTVPVVIAFGFISLLCQKHPPVIMNPRIKQPQPYAHFFGNIFPPAAFIFLLYFTFREELVHYWQLQYGQHMVPTDSNAGIYLAIENNQGLNLLKTWALNYTLCFMAIIGYVNLRYVKNKILSNSLMVVSLLAWVVFISTGIDILGQMRDAILNAENKQVIVTPFTAFRIRYITFACAALLLYVIFLYRKQVYADTYKAPLLFDFMLHLTLLVAGSSELITWFKYNEIAQFDKLGLTIFWGLYALMLIGLGIFLHRQHLRIGAIVLFGITLIKLFIYDIADMNTMTKTIVFISLGLLLLTISFLYVKYKASIGEKDEEKFRRV